MGFERITRVLIPAAEAGNLSKISVKKINIDDSPEKLAITGIQFVSVEDSGGPFCVVIYLTEGGDPMIFGVYIILEFLSLRCGRSNLWLI